MARIQVASGGGEICRFRQRQEVRQVHVRQVHLFAETVMPELLIQLASETRIECLGVLVKRGFESNQGAWLIGRELKSEVAAFENPLSRSKEKSAVLNEGAAQLGARIPT